MFGREYKPCILVHPGYFDSNAYLATLVAGLNKNPTRAIRLELNEQSIREKALLSVLAMLERMAAEKSQARTARYWEDCYREN
jgi:hypothetical protein